MGVYISATPTVPAMSPIVEFVIPMDPMSFAVICTLYIDSFWLSDYLFLKFLCGAKAIVVDYCK